MKISRKKCKKKLKEGKKSVMNVAKSLFNNFINYLLILAVIAQCRKIELTENPKAILTDKPFFAKYSLHGVSIGDSVDKLDQNLIQEKEGKVITLKDNSIFLVDSGNAIYRIKFTNPLIKEIRIESICKMKKIFGVPDVIDDEESFTHYYIYRKKRIVFYWSIFEGESERILEMIDLF